VQLKALVEHAAQESSRQHTRSVPIEKPELARYLKDWAVQYGFGIDQVRSELDRWAAEVQSKKATAYDLALAACAKQNFREAHERALDAAADEETRLASVEKERQESLAGLIRDYRLAGDAAYNELAFDKAVDVYRKP
jgi:uncharacterized membrane protein YqiK